MAAQDDELFVALTRMALAGDGVVLGIGMTVLAIRTWFKFRSHSKALKEVQETPVSRIADLRSLVEERVDQARTFEKVSCAVRMTETLATRSQLKMPFKLWRRQQLLQLPQRQDKLVIVRGKVQTKASTKSQDSTSDVDVHTAQNVDEKAVYLERTQTFLYNEWRGIFGWGYEWRGLLGRGSLKEQVTVSRRKVPFVLADTEGHRDFQPQELVVYVHINMDDARHPLPLVTVYHQLHPVPASSYTLVQAMFGRRYPVGLLDEEKILPLGKEITAVGILGTSSDGNPAIKPCKHLPVFLTEYTRDQLVGELANGTKVLFWVGVAISTVAAGILGYAIVKNWSKWKQRQQQRQQQDEESRQDRLIGDEVENLEDIPDGDLCVVCLLRRRRAAFIYCGHRVCCVGCAQRVEQGGNPRCPVCRQPVSGIVRVFDS